MLEDASRKRQLAKQIRDQADAMVRDSLRVVAIKQAERLEHEAAGLEIVVRATKRRQDWTPLRRT
jgi:hypothetical protein